MWESSREQREVGGMRARSATRYVLTVQPERFIMIRDPRAASAESPWWEGISVGSQSLIGNEWNIIICSSRTIFIGKAAELRKNRLNAEAVSHVGKLCVPRVSEGGWVGGSSTWRSSPQGMVSVKRYLMAPSHLCWASWKARVEPWLVCLGGLGVIPFTQRLPVLFHSWPEHQVNKLSFE